MVNFNSVRAPSLVAGKLYVAQIWATRNRRVTKMVRVREVIGSRIKDGMKVVCDEFTAVTDGAVLAVDIHDKMYRVTFGTMVDDVLLLEAPKVAENIVNEAVKKARKPLTAEQKARKNELARARRAAAKVAA